MPTMEEVAKQPLEQRLGRRILGVAPGDGVEIRRLSTPPIPGGLVRGR